MRNTLLISIFFFVLVGCKNEVSVKDDNIQQNYYSEQFRSQIHFSPESNWMNDPNGMFYIDSTYHLFYQYYPDSNVWGPMHWGHATSKDLMHWDHQPIALYPDSLGYIFSGSAVVDSKNTSGFGTTDNPPIIAAFTHHNMKGEKAGRSDYQYQSIAFSIDKGETWKKYNGNPVIPNPGNIKDFRDPKVTWDEENQQWLMVLAVYDHVNIYRSEDLKSWEFLSEFGIENDTRLWECPDLFPIKVENSDEIKWVLIVSIQKEAPNGGTASSYFTGDFDGKYFIADANNQKWLDYGTDNYAYVTWDNAPLASNEKYGIGWMSNWQYAQVVPTTKWRSAMTLPRKLKLIKKEDDYFLKSEVVQTVENLRGEGKEIIVENSNWEENYEYPMELSFDLNMSCSGKIELELINEINQSYTIIIDPSNGKLFTDRTNITSQKFSEDYFKKHEAPLPEGIENMDFSIYFDASSVEIFAGDGLLNFTQILFPEENFTKISIKATENCGVQNGKWWELESVWR